MRRTSFLVALTLMVSASAAVAQEGEGGGMRAPGHLLDASDQQRSQELSFFIGIPYGYLGYGFAATIGARYYIPIVKNGFIPALNDEFGIEFGVDVGAHLYYRFAYGDIDIPVEVLWRFHFTPKFDAYAKIGIGLGFNTYDPYYGVVTFYPYITTAVGLFYRLNDVLSLRAEIGYPGVKIGLAIAL